MIANFAQKSDVEHLVRFFKEHLSIEAEKISLTHARSEGREPWTKAVWHCFDILRREMWPDWTLYPDQPARGAGRAKGEYLADFMLMDDKFGPRIACESELGNIGKIDWSFDKLRGVKADIKILIFEMTFTDDAMLPESVSKMISGYLANHAHFLPNEYFLLLQLSGNKTRSFVWEAIERGPYTVDQIRFTAL
jgi:hypothetical protein